MALPADVATRTVHGRWLNMAGAAMTGTVTFAPSAARLVDGAYQTVIVGTTITATLDAGGEITATLVCTDDSDLAGGPFTYLCSVSFGTGGAATAYTFSFELPTSPSSTLELPTVTPVPAVTPTGQYVTTVNGHTGMVVLTPADISALALTGGTLTGSLNLTSTFDGGEDTTDSTTRINQQSYQRNGTHFFGEVHRIDLLPHSSVANAKAMVAWRMPRPPANDDLTTMRSVTWMGAHWASQDDPSVIHGHWSIETPDGSDALRTRLEILISNQAQTAIGSDKTLILTNQADFVVRCDNGQVLRLKTGAGAVKALEFANADWGDTGKRWQIRQNGTSEAGSNAGSDLEVGRFNDSGVEQDKPLIVTRSNGKVTIGGTAGTAGNLTVNRASSGTTVLVDTYLAGAGANGTTAFQHLSKDSTSRVLSSLISTATTASLVVFADGKIEIGPGGSTARDTNLYRAAADTLKTDDSFHVGANLSHLGSNLGFYGTTPAAKPAVTGSRGSNAALTSLLTALAGLGLLTDTSS